MQSEVKLTQQSIDHFYAVAQHQILRRCVRSIRFSLDELDLVFLTIAQFDRAKAAAKSIDRKPRHSLEAMCSYDTFLDFYGRGVKLFKTLQESEFDNFVEACKSLSCLQRVVLWCDDRIIEQPGDDRTLHW